MLSLAMLPPACAPPPEPAPPASVAPEPVVGERFPSILFEPDTVELSPTQRRLIRDIAAVLKHPAVADRSVNVEGHTDAVGSRDVNERVSLERAKAVANELIFNGVSPERLQVIGLGDTQPAAPNTDPDGTDNPEGRKLNRRVEIVVERSAE